MLAFYHDRNHSLVQVHVYRAYTVILGLQFLYMPRYMLTRFDMFIPDTATHVLMQIVIHMSHTYMSTYYLSLIFHAQSCAWM